MSLSQAWRPCRLNSIPNQGIGAGARQSATLNFSANVSGVTFKESF